MSRFSDVKVYVLVDSNGDIVVSHGDDECDIQKVYADAIGDTGTQKRVYSFLLKVPVPELVNLGEVILDFEAGPQTVTIE